MNWKIIVKEMPEEEQQKKLEEYRKKWKYPMGRDGFIETWRKSFTYKGIKFELAILRYFTLDEGFKPMGNRKSDRHVVVEYPKATEPLVKFVNSLGWDDFLWHDTLHSWNDNQTIEEQLDEAYRMAMNDIDYLPQWFEEKEKELKSKLEEIRSFKERFVEVVRND